MSNLKDRPARSARAFQAYASKRRALALAFRACVIVLTASMFFFVLLRDASENDLRDVVFQVISDPHEASDEASASIALSSAPSVLKRATSRSTHPFWLRIPLRTLQPEDVILLGDKQLSAISVWFPDADGRLVHAADYDRADLPAKPFERTFNSVAFHPTPQQRAAAFMLVRVRAQAASTLYVQHAHIDALAHYKQASSQAAGALAGGLALLAAFSALVSYFSATSLFITFGIWLIASIAVCATFLGYDYLWFEQWTSPEFEVRSKLFILAFYAFTTTELYLHLFRRRLAQVRMLRPIDRIGQVSVGFAVAAAFVPAAYFLPAFWTFAAIAFSASAWGILRIIARRRSVTVQWYAAGWAVQIIAGLAEVLYAAGVVPRLPGVSSESGILIAGMLTGIAVAESMRVERERRLNAQKAAANAAGQYRRIFNTVPIGMLTVSPSGQILRANRAMTEFFDELSGVDEGGTYPLANLVGNAHAKTLLSAQSGSEVVSLELRQPQPEGDPRVLSVDAIASDDGVEVTFRDTSASAKLTDTLKYLAEHDSLTGLANRRGIESKFLSVQAALANGTDVCVAYLDLDRFKLVNEFYGHAIGDAILRQVAQRMRAAAPASAFLARIGGDEFLICLPGYSQREAHSIVSGVLDCLIRQPYEIDDKALSISGSAGVVQIATGMSLTDILAFADRACTMAKGRGRAAVADLPNPAAELAEHHSRVRLGSALRAKFPADQLRIYAQPIVGLSLADPGEQYEVLLRVIDEATGKIGPPGKLISIAEHQGLMADVDRFVLRGTLEHLSNNQARMPDLDFLAINLSAMSLNDERFVSDAIALLSEHECVARQVMLEITESVALSDVPGTRRFVDQMRSRGVRIALDDFGAGYTSFSYLKNFPANLVKIDGAFIRDLNRHPANYAITRAITSLCHELKIPCLAEWVEDVPTLLGLLELDMDYAQGFVFAPAMPMAHWIENKPDLLPLQQATQTFSRQAPLRMRG